MASRQTYVVGALGVLVGMVVGAQSAQRAELVSFSGSDPNSEIIQSMPNLRRATRLIRPGAYQDNVYNTVNARYAPVRPASIEDMVMQRRNVRLSGQDLMHSSAPTRTVRGAPAQLPFWDSTCGDLSTARGQACNYARQNGLPYEQNYFPTSY